MKPCCRSGKKLGMRSSSRHKQSFIAEGNGINFLPQIGKWGDPTQVSPFIQKIIL